MPLGAGASDTQECRGDGQGGNEATEGNVGLCQFNPVTSQGGVPSYSHFALLFFTCFCLFGERATLGLE